MQREIRTHKPRPFLTLIRQTWRRGTMVLLMANAMFSAVLTVSADQQGGGPKVFHAGFLQRVFSNVDSRDAKAVLEVHASEISRVLDLNAVAKVIMFEDMETMTEALRKGELALASIPAIEYLRNRETVLLIPSFFGVYQNGPGINYVLITRKDRGIRSFSDLKGKSILLPPVTSHEPCHIWLDILLLKTGNAERDKFFSQVREPVKISSAIMSVFFQQADAAIVTRSSLETNLALNPQLAAQLSILIESPNLSDNLVCMTPGSTEKFRNSLYQAMLRLNESKSGRQVYTMLQTSGIAPYRQENNKELDDLTQEQNPLKSKTLKRK